MYIPIIVFVCFIVAGIVTLSILNRMAGKKEQERYNKIDQKK